MAEALHFLVSSYTNKAIVIKTVFLAKIDTWTKGTKFARPEINPHAYGQLRFEKRIKNTQWGKDNLFKKWCSENHMDNHMQKLEIGPQYTSLKN